jgi:transcriptional regulator with XRE-family HTH domain
MSIITMRFGIALRHHRLELGLSQEGLALAAGIHPTHVGLIERGLRSPSLRVAKGLADALGLSLHSLIAEAELDVGSR